MKIMHKSLIGAIVGLVCANSAMAADCSLTNAAPKLSDVVLKPAIGVTAGATAGALAPLVLPFSPVAATLAVTAGATVGGAIGVASIGFFRPESRPDYLCVGNDKSKCFQCDKHQVGKTFECDEADVVSIFKNGSATVESYQCQYVTKNSNAWQYLIPVWGVFKMGRDVIDSLDGIGQWSPWTLRYCSDSKEITSNDGAYVDIIDNNQRIKRATGVVVSTKSACIKIDCKDGYEYNATQKKCVKKGGPTPPDGNVDEQKCYERGGIPMTNGNCRCPDGEWYSEKAKHCTPKNGCSDCRGGVFIINNNGGVVIIGDNNNVNIGGGNGGGRSSLQECLASRATVNGKACCYLPKTGINGSKYNAQTDTCTCNDPNKKFSVGADGHGQCLPGNGPVVPHPGITCPANMYVANDGSCKCNAPFQDPAKEKLKVCECGIPDAHNDASGKCVCNDSKKTIVEDGQGGGKCEAPGVQCDPATQVKDGDKCKCIATDASIENGVCKCNNKDMVLKDNKCVMDESKIEEIRGRITATFSRLSSTMGGFEKSVWKNAEGEFNTARLASDSIAGVVLGTAGGIITSKLVKKNQLKTGFEDIKCSIGGQTVASYGDTFSVGM